MTYAILTTISKMGKISSAPLESIAMEDVYYAMGAAFYGQDNDAAIVAVSARTGKILASADSVANEDAEISDEALDAFIDQLMTALKQE